MNHPRVLVVDDKDTIVTLLARILAPEFAVTTAEDGTRALGLIASTEFDVIVSDIRMPGADGMAVLAEARRAHPDTEVILMTAYATVQDAVAAMKLGAYDYLQKPFEPDEVLFVVRRAVERRQLRAQARDLQAALAGAHRLDGLVAESAAMRKILELVHRAATSDVTVLISGESGTGKEVVAHAIHRASARATKRFVPVNCGAMPEALFEAELFGYTKGAFTGASADRAGLFQEADRGTLLLDEIGEIPLAMQVKLNRALQERAIRRVGDSLERTIDVRVIAATNVDLRAAVDVGRFREDLFYRLNVYPIHLPPLRERRDDIALLATLFVDRHRRDGQADGFTADALGALLDYDWPGNVRQLENVVQRALAVSDGSKIAVTDFTDELTGGRSRMCGTRKHAPPAAQARRALRRLQAEVRYVTARVTVRDDDFASRPHDRTYTHMMMKLFALLVPLALAGSAQADAPKAKTTRIAVAVTKQGFDPDSINVPAKQPVTLVFTRKTDETCTKSVVVTLDDGKTIERELPLEKPVEIAVTFPQAGKLGYACSMNMSKGVIVVQ